MFAGRHAPHVLANASADDVAVSVHLYAPPLREVIALDDDDDCAGAVNVYYARSGDRRDDDERAATAGSGGRRAASFVGDDGGVATATACAPGAHPRSRRSCSSTGSAAGR